MKTATLIVTVLALLGVAALLMVTDLPEFPLWLGPAHFSSSLVVAVALASFGAIWWSRSAVETSWLTLISGCVLVVLLEFLQLLNPARTFEFEDMLIGVAGISAGAMASCGLLKLLGKTAFASVALPSILAAGALIVHYTTSGAGDSDLSCSVQNAADINWDSFLITDFSPNAGAATGNKIGFCVAENDLVASNDVTYTADLRLSLDGLAEAVRQHRTFVMGIHFTTIQERSFTEIVSLTWQDSPNRYFSRLHRSGKHLMTTLQFNGGERTVASLANRVVTGKPQQLVVVYDGQQQTTWLNGKIVATEINFLNPPKIKNAELMLNIGQIADGRSWSPFKGEIKGIYLGTRVLDEAQVNALFNETI